MTLSIPRPLSPAVCAAMKRVLVLVLLWVMGADVCVAKAACPRLCSCRPGVVDCSWRGLTTDTLPSSFPTDTTELHLHDNLLTALPTGLLNELQALRTVSLHGNPWICDCQVLYLRGWLLKQSSDALIRFVCVCVCLCLRVLATGHLHQIAVRSLI